MNAVLPLPSDLHGTPRVHGGPDAHGVPVHDFSTNVNACGPCPAALAAVQAADAAHYPDAAYTALRAALAAHHGVAPGRIVLAASGSEFIQRITAWAARRGLQAAGVPRHAYGDYAAAASAWDLRVVVEDAAPLLWLCEPSSPLGQDEARWPLAGRAALAVLDCAYAPLRLAGDAAAPDRLAACWQLWTPNKALGLPGVRAAYAVAPAHGQQDVAGLESLAPSWPVGAHGVALLQAWCQPAVQQWLQDSLPLLRTWKAAQQALCEQHGWTVLPGQANFFVCRVGSAAQAAAAVQALRAHGIKLRDAASFGLPGHVRLGVRPPASQRALARAWEAGA